MSERKGDQMRTEIEEYLAEGTLDEIEAVYDFIAPKETKDQHTAVAKAAWADEHAEAEVEADAILADEQEPDHIKRWLETNVRHGESIACDVEPILDKNSNDIIGIAITPVDGVGVLHIDC